MALSDVLSKLDPAIRPEIEEAVKAEVAAGNPLAGIDNADKAADFMGKNPFFKSAYDAGISRAVASHDERFQKEKVPELVKAELKKLNPEKDPIRAELEALKAEREQERAQLKREKLTAYAVKLAADEGIPLDEIERFIGDDEDVTQSQVKAFAKTLKKWADERTDRVLKERLGNNGKPGSGAPPNPADLKTLYAEAEKKGDGMEMLRIKALMQRVTNQE